MKRGIKAHWPEVAVYFMAIAGAVDVVKHFRDGVSVIAVCAGLACAALLIHRA